MPRFSLLRDCPDELYWAVLGVFGFSAKGLLVQEILAPDPEATGAGLDRHRAGLLAIHRPTDHARCVPESWTRRACLQLLRHLLAPRGLVLSSRFVWRRGRGSVRTYSVAPRGADDTTGVSRVSRRLDLS